MKYWYVLIVVFSLFIFSCDKKDKHERAMNDTGYDVRKLKEDVLYRGDVDSYNLLFIEYLEYPPGEFLPYALIMANKDNNSAFCYDVFLSIYFIYNNGNSNYIDELTAKMAIEYLEKAAKGGGEEAKLRLEKLPKKNIKLTYKEKYKYVIGNG